MHQRWFFRQTSANGSEQATSWDELEGKIYTSHCIPELYKGYNKFVFLVLKLKIKERNAINTSLLQLQLLKKNDVEL